MTDQRMLSAIRRRRARTAAMGKLLLEGFEPAHWRERVRRSEVVEYMARRLGYGHPKNAPFVQQVTRWCKALGWRHVRPVGRSYFRGVRPRQKAPLVMPVVRVAREELQRLYPDPRQKAVGA